ncbi:helix-turn-helix domain-containing protein [Haliovirga abyssi]|uniref:Transposase n=1 Tax=Haliovirga abyssi TaxID=2996794 RepID=A0AAU9DH05_9FUSO|nr:helix-turn-helix domain-containing protein [Haliovirga abyssi]BDU51578.1 hypothetical protein HLVA_21470 [Haliovirga abyssi]
MGKKIDLENKFEIIKPFLEKKKKLKEISEQNGIPYSTLKRWVNNYKKNGKDGLKKANRSDKNKHRSLNDEGINYIKKLYFQNPNQNILNIYENAVEFLTSKNQKNISYDTVYRIVNNLDPFVKKYADLSSVTHSNDRFEFFSVSLDIMVLDELTDEYLTPYINIIFDSFSHAIVTFSISFKKADLELIKLIFRKAILKKNFTNKNIYGIPKTFLINNIKITPKIELYDLEKNLPIKIKIVTNEESSFQSFFTKLENHIKKISKKYDFFDYNSLKESVEKYITDLNNNKFYDKWEKNIKNFRESESEKELNFLLVKSPSTRKVIDSRVRFNNLIYFSPVLSEYNNQNISIEYNPLSVSQINIYFEDKLLGVAVCNELIDKEISLYELKVIQRTIMINHLNKKINQSVFFRETIKLINDN